MAAFPLKEDWDLIWLENDLCHLSNNMVGDLRRVPREGFGDKGEATVKGLLSPKLQTFENCLFISVACPIGSWLLLIHTLHRFDCTRS